MHNKRVNADKPKCRLAGYPRRSAPAILNILLVRNLLKGIETI